MIKCLLSPQICGLIFNIIFLLFIITQELTKVFTPHHINSIFKFDKRSAHALIVSFCTVGFHFRVQLPSLNHRSDKDLLPRKI